MAPRTRRVGPTSDRTRRGRRYNRSPSPLAAAPTQCSSFRLHTLVDQYGMLSGSDCKNNRLHEATGVKRRETVGIVTGKKVHAQRVKYLCHRAFPFWENGQSRA